MKKPKKMFGPIETMPKTMKTPKIKKIRIKKGK